jgi:hypothetical protein
LGKPILILLLVNAYISITRVSVDAYIEAYGLFGHVWAPWMEAFINLGLSLLLGYKYGIAGVLTGTAVSVILIVCIWRPYYLFTGGFKNGRIWEYWSNIFKYLGSLAIVWLVVHFIASIDSFSSVATYWSLMIRITFIFFMSSLLYGLILYMTSSGMKNFTHRMLFFFRQKFRSKKLNNSILS